MPDPQHRLAIVPPDLAVSDEIATTCDECGASIAFGSMGVMRDTGETWDEMKVIRILCRECAGV